MATNMKNIERPLAQIGGMTLWLRLITPAVAAAMMARNNCNRGLKVSRVKLYTDIMERTWWDWRTWEPVKVYEDGVLADGQHRLSAVIASGVAVEMLVVEGVPRDVGRLLDSGLAKTASDVLHMKGVPQSNVMAAATRQIIIAVVAPHMLGFGSGGGGSFVWLGKEVVLSVMPKLEGLVDTLTLAQGVKHFMPASSACALAFLMRRADRERADWFFERLADGVGLDENSPVRTVREYLARAPRHAGTLQERAAKVVSAWNACCEGRPLSRMQYGGKTPPIHGLDYDAVAALAPDVMVRTK